MAVITKHQADETAGTPIRDTALYNQQEAALDQAVPDAYPREASERDTEEPEIDVAFTDHGTPDGHPFRRGHWVSNDEYEILMDQHQRLAADFANYRRRTEQQRDALVGQGLQQAVCPMLTVYDDLARSLEAITEIELDAAASSEIAATLHSLREGIDLVHRRFADELTALGVTPIEALGQPFNVNEHEAMMQMPAPEGTDSGIVLQEFQTGYRLGNSVLRHSKVVVSM